MSASLLFVTAAAPSAAQERPSRRPNVLLLMADELRADALGFAGNTVVATPKLDALAAASARFRAAYTASPVCAPARAALFTGRYPQSNGVLLNDESLRSDEVTLPEILGQNGYETAMFGKLHVQREHFGQDVFDWISAHTNWRFQSGFFDEELLSRNGFSRKYQAFVEKELQVPYDGWRVYAGSVVETGEYDLKIATHAVPPRLTEEAWIADQAIEFLMRRTEGDAPWFLVVSMSKPHSPYIIPLPYANLYAAAEMELPSTFRPARALARGRSSGRATIADTRILREVIAHYFGAVTLVDDQMGRVLASVERLGLIDDTLIIFTSDHGNMLGERNRLFKSLMYEASARVPLLVRLPAAQADRRLDTEAATDLTAIVPTVLDVAQIPIPMRVQGRSLFDQPTGRATRDAAQERMAFSRLEDDMVVWRDFKLIEAIAGTGGARAAELYDLARDPNEQHNLYGQPPTADVQRRLEAALVAWRSRVSN